VEENLSRRSAAACRSLSPNPLGERVPRQGRERACTLQGLAPCKGAAQRIVRVLGKVAACKGLHPARACTLQGHYVPHGTKPSLSQPSVILAGCKPKRTGGVPKGRDFDNPRRQPGGTWPHDQVAPTGRYVVSPHRHMRRFRQRRYRNRFSYTGATNGFSHAAAAGNAPLGLSRVGLAAMPPADAGGYRNYVPSGRFRIFRCERARKKREGAWLISIRLAENFGVPPDKRVQSKVEEVMSSQTKRGQTPFAGCKPSPAGAEGGRTAVGWSNEARCGKAAHKGRVGEGFAAVGQAPKSDAKRTAANPPQSPLVRGEDNHPVHPVESPLSLLVGRKNNFDRMNRMTPLLPLVRGKANPRAFDGDGLSGCPVKQEAPIKNGGIAASVFRVVQSSGKIRTCA
jgi:hypothetical protein